MGLLEYSASLPGGGGVLLLQGAASVPGVMGSATLAMRPHCLGAGAVGLLQRTASLPGVSGQCNSYQALPKCLRAVGSRTRAAECVAAWRQWAMLLLQYSASLLGGGGVLLLQGVASLPGGSGHCNSCNALPHCLGAVGNAILAIHCLTAWG